MAYINRPLDTSATTVMTIKAGGDLINDNFEEIPNLLAEKADRGVVTTRARNVTGSTIVKGRVVYVSGATGGDPQIALATAGQVPVGCILGLVLNDITNNQFGEVVTFGVIDNINTSGLTLGQPVFLSTTTAGTLTSTKPTKNAIKIGLVLVVGTGNGKLHVCIGDADEYIRDSELTGKVGDYFGLDFEPSVQPSISSDFSRNEHKLMEEYGLVEKQLTDLWTVDRNSTATRVDHRGMIVPVAVNQPRVDWSSGKPALLVEEQRTNIFLQSQRFDINTVRTSDVSIVETNTFLGVSQAAYVEKLVTTSFVYKSGAVGGTEYTLTVFVKMDDGSSPVIGGSGDFVIRVGGIICNNIAVTGYTNGIYKVTGTAVASSTFPNNSGLSAGTGSSSKKLTVLAMQLEQASTPSSYIPTQASAVTRLADNVRRELGSEFNPREGVILTNVNKPISKTGVSADDRQTLISFSVGNTGNPRFNVFEANGSMNLVLIGDGLVTQTSLNLSMLSDKNRIAIRYKNGHISIFHNGVNVLDNPFFTSQPILNWNTWHFGRLAVNSRYSNAGFSLGSYYPRALSDAECQELTRI